MILKASSILTTLINFYDKNAIYKNSYYPVLNILRAVLLILNCMSKNNEFIRCND